MEPKKKTIDMLKKHLHHAVSKRCAWAAKVTVERLNVVFRSRILLVSFDFEEFPL
jgi:hypothetical protein